VNGAREFGLHSRLANDLPLEFASGFACSSLPPKAASAPFSPFLSSQVIAKCAVLTHACLESTPIR